MSTLTSKYPNSPLNIEVSRFSNVLAVTPTKYNLLDLLNDPHTKNNVEKLRNETDEKKRSKLKLLLPSITPSGVFSKRNLNSLVKHSNLIQFDIDFKDNQQILNYSDLKKQISNIPNVAYTGLSVSGNGYWGLIPIAYAEKHKEHFTLIEQSFFNLGIKIDPSGSDVTRLRILSYDPDPYYNHEAKILTSFVERKIEAVIMPSSNQNTLNTDSQLIDATIRLICANRIDITGSYKDWYSLGCFFASLKENGRTNFHLISQFHSDYNKDETDRQFNACAKNKGAYKIGTFIHFCKLSGIERMSYLICWKESYEIIG